MASLFPFLSGSGNIAGCKQNWIASLKAFTKEKSFKFIVFVIGRLLGSVQCSVIFGGWAWWWLGLMVVGPDGGWGLMVVGPDGGWAWWWLGLMVVGPDGGWAWWWLGLMVVGPDGGWAWWWLGLMVVGPDGGWAWWWLGLMVVGPDGGWAWWFRFGLEYVPMGYARLAQVYWASNGLQWSA